MEGFRFCTGQRLLIGEREYIIEREQGDGNLQLRDEATNTYVQRTETALLNLYSEGSIRMLHDPQAESYCKQKFGKLRDAETNYLPPKVKLEFERRYAYVKAAINIGITRLTVEEFEGIREKLGEQLKDPNPPSGMQLYRWHDTYKKSDKDIRSLIPRYANRGCRQDRFPGEVNEIVEKKINEVYLNPQRNSAHDVYEAIVAEVGLRNRIRPDADELGYPSNQTIWNYIKKLDPYEVMKTRYGKLAADRQFRPMEKNPQPTYPLERVEFDHTKLDLFVVDVERRMPIGRPWLTTALDIFSTSTIGFYLGFTPPSYLSVGKCLKNAIAPKGYVEREYTNINHKWDARGIMDTAVVDRGMEFRSLNFENACLQLGIVIQYAPPRLPWYKGGVERYFRVMNTGLIHKQRGTTFSNIFDKGDYDPKKNAIIDLPTLRWAIHKWIIDVHNRQPNKGLKGIPALMWAKGIENFPPVMPRSISELNILIGMTAERKITKSGIELHGLFYNDWNLNTYRREAGKDGKVTVKYDPEDLSLIHVWDTLRMSFIPVFAVDQEYTRGLTLWQHDVIKRYARDYIKANYDIVALCIAKAEIQEIVDDEWNRRGKSGSLVRMARWKKIDGDTKGIVEIPDESVVGNNRANPMQSNPQDLVLPNAELNYANGISAIGQTVSTSDDGINQTADENDKSGLIISTEVAEQEGGNTKASKKEKGKLKNTSAIGKKANEKSKLEQRLKNEIPKVIEKEKSPDLDLTGWGINYMKR